MSEHLPPRRASSTSSEFPPPPPPPAPPPPPHEPRLQPGEHAVPFNAFDGLGLVVWTIIAQVIVGVAIAVVILATGNDDAFAEGGSLQAGAGLLAIAIAGQVVTLAGVLGWLKLRNRLTGHLIGLGPHGMRAGLLGLAGGVGGYVVATGVALALSLLIDPGEGNQAILDAFEDGTAGLALGIIASVIMAPLVEELIFRGVLFQSLRHRMGVVWAVAISSLVFAHIHIDFVFPYRPVQIVALTVLAAWFALLLHWTRSLVVPIVAHATFNLITAILFVSLDV